MRTNASIAASLTLLLLPGALLAQDRWGSVPGLYGSWELQRGGQPLQGQLFKRGWPTDEEYQHLTQVLAAEPGRTLAWLSVTPGSGAPITASQWERDRLEKLGGKARVRDTQGLLRETLSHFKDLSGYDAPLPRSFVPGFLPYQMVKPDLSSTWRADEPLSWERSSLGGKVDLEAAGFALLARAELVDQELQATHGRGLVGHDGVSGFMALVALHTSLALAYELRQAVYGSREGELIKRDDLLSLDEFRYFFPSEWEAVVDDDRLVHRLAGDTSRLKSQLRGQAALLLGLCKLSEVVEGSGQKYLRDMGDGKEAQEVVQEGTLFVFRLLRSLHVNVRLGQAVSEQGGSTIQTVDLGLYLMGLRSFLKAMPAPKERSNNPMVELIGEERGKAVTLVNTLSNALRIWQQQREDGFFNVYSVQTKSGDTSKGESLASNAFAIRGLIATHRSLSDDGRETEYLKAARLAVAKLDERRWNRSVAAYTDDGRTPKVTVFGALAVLGALREMALVTGEGRYLSRYRQYLESLSANGMLAGGSDRTALHLPQEITLESGSK